jgi:hypothetical protein
MKRIHLVAAVTLVAFLSTLLPAGGAWAAKKKPKVDPNAAPSVTTGSLQITCTVTGAQYEIDEGSDTAMKGATPVAAPITLPPGPHTIRVSKEGFLPFSDVFDVAAGQTTEVEVDMVLYSGTLQVDATPAPVQVQIDEKAMGAAPVKADLSIGEHVVRLSKPGYVEEVRKVFLKTGQATDLSVKLVAIAEVQRRTGGGPIYKAWWFWTILGAVAAGVVVPTAVVLSRPKTTQQKADAVFTLP